MCLHHIVAQGVSVRISLHPHAIHDVTCLSVRCLSSFCLPSLYLSLLLCLFYSLLVLCPAHHLQCRHRRGLKPLHSRTKRSIAPWRYTILSHTQVPNQTCESGGLGHEKEIKFLKCVITYNTDGWTWTGDPTLSKKLVNELNLGGAKAAVTPSSKATGVNDPHSEDNLTPEKTEKVRSLAGRLLYLSLYEPHVQFETGLVMRQSAR